MEDTLNHKNIIKYCSRPFENVEQMNNTLIKNWNEIINFEDVVYHLGDFALGSKKLILEIVNKLNGNKYIIRGDVNYEIFKKINGGKNIFISKRFFRRRNTKVCRMDE